jgi:hypothetical protein
MLIKISVSAADEWAIHRRAVDVVFAQQSNLGSIIRYNSKLNNHERVTEYAESLGAEVAVARYFGLDYDINANKGKRLADVGKALEVRWTSYIGGNLIVYPNDRDHDIAFWSLESLQNTSSQAGFQLCLPRSSGSRIRVKNPGGLVKET